MSADNNNVIDLTVQPETEAEIKPVRPILKRETVDLVMSRIENTLESVNSMSDHDNESHTRMLNVIKLISTTVGRRMDDDQIETVLNYCLELETLLGKQEDRSAPTAESDQNAIEAALKKQKERLQRFRCVMDEIDCLSDDASDEQDEIVQIVEEMNGELVSRIKQEKPRGSSFNVHYEIGLASGREARIDQLMESLEEQTQEEASDELAELRFVIDHEINCWNACIDEIKRLQADREQMQQQLTVEKDKFVNASLQSLKTNERVLQLLDRAGSVNNVNKKRSVDSPGDEEERCSPKNKKKRKVDRPADDLTEPHNEQVTRMHAIVNETVADVVEQFESDAIDPAVKRLEELKTLLDELEDSLSTMNDELGERQYEIEQLREEKQALQDKVKQLEESQKLGDENKA